MNAAFSREAAKLVNAPYFRRSPPDGLDDDKFFAWVDWRAKELDAFRHALSSANNYRELNPTMQAVFDKAKASMGKNNA